MSRNKANTTKELVDKALEKPGWSLDDSNQVRIEIPVDGYDAEHWNGIIPILLFPGKNQDFCRGEAFLAQS